MIVKLCLEEFKLEILLIDLEFQFGIRGPIKQRTFCPVSGLQKGWSNLTKLFLIVKLCLMYYLEHNRNFDMIHISRTSSIVTQRKKSHSINYHQQKLKTF